jgi:ubiquinone/menaquinone biosynthesis C-methylase UbiE
MSTADQYVNLRVKRLKPEDLRRSPNKWLTSLPQYHTADRVLDIACGMGYASLAWAREGKRPVGIDFNWGLVKNAADLATQQGLKIDFVVADATRLPFREDSFDFCFSENLFEHVPVWQKIVSEARRVLNAEGVLFIRTSNRHCPINREINHMHFYPWLPSSLKRPILHWIQRRRPAWINYSQFPAVNWFTHRGLAKSLKAEGFSTYEMFDLVRKDLLAPKRRKLAFLFDAFKRFRPLRYLVYPLIGSVQVVGVKKNSSEATKSEAHLRRAIGVA